MTPHTTTDTPKARRTHTPAFDPKSPPPMVDRSMAARLLLETLGIRVSPRTLEVWPVTVRRVNNRAMMPTSELLAHGRAMLDSAPVIRGGRTRKAA